MFIKLKGVNLNRFTPFFISMNLDFEKTDIATHLARLEEYTKMLNTTGKTYEELESLEFALYATEKIIIKYIARHVHTADPEDFGVYFGHEAPTKEQLNRVIDAEIVGYQYLDNTRPHINGLDIILKLKGGVETDVATLEIGTIINLQRWQ